MGLFNLIGGIKKAFGTAKKVVFGEKEPKIPIQTIIETEYPETYRDYYETLGHKTDVFEKDGRTYLVVWKIGVKDKEINDFLKLSKVV